jgi:hypothetical protein
MKKATPVEGLFEISLLSDDMKEKYLKLLESRVEMFK